MLEGSHKRSERLARFCIRECRQQHDLGGRHWRKSKPLADLGCARRGKSAREDGSGQAGRHRGGNGEGATTQEDLGPRYSRSIKRARGEVPDAAGWRRRSQSQRLARAVDKARCGVPTEMLQRQDLAVAAIVLPADDRSVNSPRSKSSSRSRELSSRTWMVSAGSSACNRASSVGTSARPTWAAIPTEKRRRAEVKPATARSWAARKSRAEARNTAPCADKRTSRGVRSISFWPTRSSSRFSFTLIAPWVVPSASAARVKLGDGAEPGLPWCSPSLPGRQSPSDRSRGRAPDMMNVSARSRGACERRLKGRDIRPAVRHCRARPWRGRRRRSGPCRGSRRDRRVQARPRRSARR